MRAMRGRKYYGGGGLEGISPDIGAAISRDLKIHDDGVLHFGGISMMTSGPMGCGKTTFLLQLAPAVGSMNNGGCKEYYRSDMPLNPETVIWRGRRYDYWNTMIASNWIQSFPQTPIVRPVRVHAHVDDDLNFFEQSTVKEEVEFDNAELGFEYYRDASDLYNHILPGAINVVYEPNHYYLNPDVVIEMTKKTLEDLRQTRLRRKRKIREAKKDGTLDADQVEAPSAVFWYEFLEYLQTSNIERKFYSVFIDESHQVCPMNPIGELYHLGNWMATQMIDFRRNNISLFMSTHDIKLVDYRVVDRILYFSWMPGARIYPRISRVWQPITYVLPKGKMILEEANKQFGRATYDKIPFQPPIIYVEGLKAST